MMNDKTINSVTGQAEPPVLSEAELEAKAKQFYEDWLRDVSAIKSYTEWLDYLSNQGMEEEPYPDPPVGDGLVWVMAGKSDSD